MVLTRFTCRARDRRPHAQRRSTDPGGRGQHIEPHPHVAQESGPDRQIKHLIPGQKHLGQNHQIGARILALGQQLLGQRYIAGNIARHGVCLGQVNAKRIWRCHEVASGCSSATA